MFDPLKAKSKLILYTALAFLFGLGMASGLDWTEGSFAGVPFQELQLQEESPVPASTVRPAADLSQAFIAISDVVTPAVVRIEVESEGQARGGRELRGIPEEFRRFFGPPDAPQQPRLRGGSGFIATHDGYILTNNHVVEGADRISVWTRDGRYFNATLVGNDPTTDLAVLKIDGNDLPALKFGDSDAARVGEWVLALGNPGLGNGPSGSLDYTLTAGIVSAKHRSIGIIQQTLAQQGREEMASYAIEDFIQTDAVINPGNSGGPLVNLEGEVVGVNSAISSVTGYYMGYGFAIPINLAEKVMADLIEYGEVRRPWLGVRIDPVEPADAEAFDLPRVAGIIVQGFPDESPARQAGLEQGDVIVAVDGKDVASVGQLQQRIARYSPGDDVTVAYYRDGERREVGVELGRAPFSADEPVASGPEPRPTGEKLGITVTPLTAPVAQQCQFQETGGVVIENVRPLGPAGRSQYLGRCVKILEIGGTEISGPDDVDAALSDVEPGEIVTLRVEYPDGTSRIVNVRIPA